MSDIKLYILMIARRIKRQNVTQLSFNRSSVQAPRLSPVSQSDWQGRSHVFVFIGGGGGGGEGRGGGGGEFGHLEVRGRSNPQWGPALSPGSQVCCNKIFAEISGNGCEARLAQGGPYGFRSGPTGGTCPLCHPPPPPPPQGRLRPCHTGDPSVHRVTLLFLSFLFLQTT